MKLDPEHLPRVGKDTTSIDRSAQRGRVGDAKSQAAARSTEKSAGDGLTLSPQADRFRQLRLRVASLPETGQAERVAALKSLVASGKYNVDGATVAQAVLSDEATAAALGLPPSG